MKLSRELVYVGFLKVDFIFSDQFYVGFLSLHFNLWFWKKGCGKNTGWRLWNRFYSLLISWYLCFTFLFYFFGVNNSSLGFKLNMILYVLENLKKIILVLSKQKVLLWRMTWVSYFWYSTYIPSLYYTGVIFILFLCKLFYKCNFKVFAANVVFLRQQLWMWLKNWWASTMMSLYGAMKGCLQIVAMVEMNSVFVICESLRVNVFWGGWVRIVQTERVFLFW